MPVKRTNVRKKKTGAAVEYYHDTGPASNINTGENRMKRKEMEREIRQLLKEASADVLDLVLRILRKLERERDKEGGGV